MNCTPSPKAAKPVWAKQLIRLPCLVVYVKYEFVSATKTKMGSQLLLATTSSQVQISRRFEKAFNECLGVSNVFRREPKPLKKEAYSTKTADTASDRALQFDITKAS